MKSWNEKEVNARHHPLGEFSQMDNMLEHIPEFMESDAFSLTCTTKEALDAGNTKAGTGATSEVTLEVDTALVVETPEVAEEMEVEHREGRAMPTEEENYVSIPEFLHHYYPQPTGAGANNKARAKELIGGSGDEHPTAEYGNEQETKRYSNEEEVALVAPYISAEHQEFLYNNFQASDRRVMPGPGGTTVLVVLEEEGGMTTELPTEEEDLHIHHLRNAEEAAHRRRTQALPTDEVETASAVETDSVDKSESRQNEHANLGRETTLEEASSNIKPGDTNATTSENEGKTAAKEKTADNAGPPDGAADL